MKEYRRSIGLNRWFTAMIASGGISENCRSGFTDARNQPVGGAITEQMLHLDVGQSRIFWESCY